MQIPGDKLQLRAWGFSVVLHGLIVSLVATFMGQIKPLARKDVFEWEVSLVQPVVQETKGPPMKLVPPSTAPRLQPKVTQSARQIPQIVTRQVQTMERPTVIQRVVQQVAEPLKAREDKIKPIERTVAVHERQAVISEQHEIQEDVVHERAVEQAAEAEMAHESAHAKIVQPIIDRASVDTSAQFIERVTKRVTTGEPVAASSLPAVVTQESRTITAAPAQYALAQPMAVEAARYSVERRMIERAAVTRRPEVPALPVMQESRTITAAPAQYALAQPMAVEAARYSVERRVIERAAVTRRPEAPALPTPPLPATGDVEPIPPMVQESASQNANESQSMHPSETDDGWVVESLRRRLAELRHYPSIARLNGWEGKVVLRAVIRADGHLAEVKVYRSSGYDALDNAAMEAVRLVCPLNLKRALSRSEIVVYIPIVYSLSS